MAEGYKRGVPDTQWWMEQFVAAERFRKNNALEDRWPIWRKYYRGQWDKRVLPLNLFFTMIRTIVPRIYFRNPAVSVVPTKPGPLQAALAQVLTRVDGKMMRQMQVKREMKRIVQDAFMFGTAFGTLGFGARYSPTPVGFASTEQPTSTRGERFEYRTDIFPNMPWFARTSTGNVLVPDGLDEFENTRWVATRHRRSLFDVKADPRFENTKDLKATSVQSKSVASPEKQIEMIDLMEVRDKKFGRVFVMARFDDHAAVLLDQEDELQVGGDVPVYPIVFNDDDEIFWGVPDSQILEPHQLEINEIRTQMMKHRRLALIKLLVQKGAIDESEMEKMMSEDVGAVVEVNRPPRLAVDKLQIASIPSDLVLMNEQVMQDVREAVGFSRNQFGEFKPGSSDTTATEATIVRMASEIRVDERRDIMADMMIKMVSNMHNIIFNHWQTEQVIDVVGPGGVPIWIKFTGDMLKAGAYNVKIDPDSSLPETRDIREKRAAEIYAILKENPLIDPVKLTQYLLQELKGVQLDDLMRVLPPPVEEPNGPIRMDQFAGLVNKSFQTANDRGFNPEQARNAAV